MELSDWILILTALIILYYTIETYKIRKETSKQNTLLAEQLLLIEKSYRFEQEKEFSYIKPFFRFEGGHHNDQEVTINYVNKGGPAYNILVKPIDKFNINISPTAIDTNEKGKLKITSDNLKIKDKWFFKIEYEDKFGKKHNNQLYYDIIKMDILSKEMDESSSL